MRRDPSSAYARYPLTMRPIALGPVEVRNRFYLSPHGVGYSVGYEPSDVFAAYYEARARGGCGLLFHSMSVLAKRSRGALITPSLGRTIPSFRAVADAVHAHGSAIIGQIHYSRVGNGWSYEPGSSEAPLFGPSAKQAADDYQVTHAMSHATIAKLVEAHGISARHLADAGYDGVAIHAAHGMLCEAFLSPYFNQRIDEYGGSLENRMRFPVECLRAIRDAIGPDRAVGVRINADELVAHAGGLTQADTRAIVARLVELQLVDFIDLDIAVEPDQMHLGMPNYLLPKQLYRPYVAAVRGAAGEIPVLSVLGRVTAIAEVEDALASGVADMVGAARGLIAEPNLLVNALAGREAESRTCLACNLCLEDSRRGTWGCAINPETARERWRAYAPAARPGRVVIVGGGPAGMEAARVAAKLGHRVMMFERRDRIGGQLNLWAALPGREIFATTPAWFERQLADLGVEVRTGTEATAELVAAERPDAIVIATGSTYVRTGETGFVKAPIPGWDQDFVFTPEQVIDGEPLQGRVLILDEERITTGPGLAELLVEHGVEVVLASRWQDPFGKLPDQVATSAIPRLKQRGVRLLVRTFIRLIGDHRVVLYDVDTDEETELEVDAVVLATGRRAETGLSTALAGTAAQVFAVGDALAPRGLTVAIHEGHRFARVIGQPDAPRDFTELYFQPPDPSLSQRPASVLLG